MNDVSKYPPATAEEREAVLALCDCIAGKSDVPETELWPKIRLVPGVLKVMKEDHGADYIREMGFNTELADQEYGPGWLDE